MEICIRHMCSIGQKVFLGFRNILRKNLNKLFSQTVVCVCVCVCVCVLFPRSFSAAPTMFSSAAHDTEITRMHLVRDRPSPLGVTADDVWCRDVPVTPGFPKGQVAPLPLSPSPGALVHSFSPPPRPPPPFPPLPPLAAPHVFRGGLLGACFSWVLLCSRCLVW